MATSDAGEASNLPDAYKELLEEYSLGDSQVLQRALAGLNLESSLEERALRTYLDNKSEEENEAPVIEKIEGREALEVSATLVQREIQETAARVEYQKAQDTLERAQQERKIASDHMMKVLRRSGKLPAEKECGIDAARGTIHELPFDGKPVLLELALHLLKMDDASLSLIEEHEGELFPEPMQEKLSRIERDAPDLKAREFLTDLASRLLELSEAGRRIVISMVKRPDAAGGLAETEDLPDSLGFLVHLCLHAAAK
jgi:hypothetical protein